MQRRDILMLAPAMVVTCAAPPRAVPPTIPASLAGRRIPQSCRQVLMVVSPHRSSVTARAWQLVRPDPGAPWQFAGEGFDVTLGRAGLAWGLGPHTPAPPAGWPVKREGDGCSPAGVFPITFAFGAVPKTAEPSIRLPYRQCTQTVRGVDDPGSRYYNQVIDATASHPTGRAARRCSATTACIAGVPSSRTTQRGGRPRGRVSSSTSGAARVPPPAVARR